MPGIFSEHVLCEQGGCFFNWHQPRIGLCISVYGCGICLCVVDGCVIYTVKKAPFVTTWGNPQHRLSCRASGTLAKRPSNEIQGFTVPLLFCS